jgi:hypothetical protein
MVMHRAGARAHATLRGMRHLEPGDVGGCAGGATRYTLNSVFRQERRSTPNAMQRVALAARVKNHEQSKCVMNVAPHKT